MKFGRTLGEFCTGGCAYVTLELIWRGRSHGSMFLAGGTCLVALGRLENAKKRLSLPLRIVVGAGIITLTELAFGLAFNRDYRVWDYREKRGNFLGQICPEYCLLWLPVSAGALALHRILFGGEKLEKSNL